MRLAGCGGWRGGGGVILGIVDSACTPYRLGGVWEGGGGGGVWLFGFVALGGGGGLWVLSLSYVAK